MHVDRRLSGRGSGRADQLAVRSTHLTLPLTVPHRNLNGKSLGWHYANGMLVRVVGEMTRGAGKPSLPFSCGIIFDRETGRAVIAAPLLRDFLGQHQDKLRLTFRRMGWKATIVKRQQG